MSLNELIQAHVERQVLLAAEILEMKIRMFMARTGLGVKEITLVSFKGKTWPQWIGAVSTFPLVVWSD